MLIEERVLGPLLAALRLSEFYGSGSGGALRSLITPFLPALPSLLMSGLACL